VSQLLEWLTIGGLAVLALNIVLCIARAVIGPSAFDRILALECITYNLSGGVVLVSLLFGTGAFMDVLLIVALLGFLGTVALTAYVEGTLGS
jgi:multisubunit Na+/H+ antiporter MnhF subunit